MKTNFAEIINVLEREKCFTHKYRALIYLEKEEIKINACCDNFKQHLEERSHQLMEEEMCELNEG